MFPTILSNAYVAGIFLGIKEEKLPKYPCMHGCAIYLSVYMKLKPACGYLSIE